MERMRQADGDMKRKTRCRKMTSVNLISSLLAAFAESVCSDIPGVVPPPGRVGHHAYGCCINSVAAESTSHKKHSGESGDTLVICDRIPHNHSLIVVDTRFVSSDKNTPIRPNVAQTKRVRMKRVSDSHSHYGSFLSPSRRLPPALRLEGKATCDSLYHTRRGLNHQRET